MIALSLAAGATSLLFMAVRLGLSSSGLALRSSLETIAALTRNRPLIEYVPPIDEMFKQARGCGILYEDCEPVRFKTETRSKFDVIRKGPIQWPTLYFAKRLQHELAN